LIILGEDEPRRRLGEAVAEAVKRRVGPGVLDIRDSLGPIVDDPASDAPHRVAVWVGKEDADLQSLEYAIAASLPILPVAVDRDFRALPALLSALNASVFGEDLAPLVEVVLRMLGLSERERRVFVSYRRDDTTPLADQLRHALLDRGFDVFIDRFSIEPGEDVQRRIDIELGDKAFVLVLESPTMHESKWIQHEITYAVQHGLALHSLMVPGVAQHQQIAELDGRRESIGLVNGTLPADALEDVCLRLEVVHASRLRRHREQMVDALRTWLVEAGFDARVGHDWTVVAERDDERRLYLITPRAPTAADLYAAHLARVRLDPDATGVVAHNPRDLDADLVALNSWVAEDRNLRTAVLEDLCATLKLL
jgi:hypothetical protein